MKIYSRSHSGSRGIAAVAVVVIIVVIVVAAGVGGYVYYTSIISKTTTTSTSSSTQTSSSSTTSSSSSTTSSSSSSTSTTTTTPTTTTTTSTTTSTSSLQFVANVGDVFGNFTQMDVAFNYTSGGSGENGSLSYDVVGYHILNQSNGVYLNVVDYNETAGNVTSGWQSYPYVIYYNSTWGATDVSYDGQANLTGSYAQFAAEAATLFYSILFNYQSSYVNSTVLSQLTKGTTSLQTFGHVQMEVTPYTASSLKEDNETITNFEVNIGQIPSTSYTMLTYLGGDFSGNNEPSASFTFYLVSATQNT